MKPLFINTVFQSNKPTVTKKKRSKSIKLKLKYIQVNSTQTSSNQNLKVNWETDHRKLPLYTNICEPTH